LLNISAALSDVAFAEVDDVREDGQVPAQVDVVLFAGLEQVWVGVRLENLALQSFFLLLLV